MESTGVKRTDTWLEFAERSVAFNEWLGDGFLILEDVYKDDKAMRQDGDQFLHSKEFRNARLAYRRRVNGSPDGETT